LSNPPFGVTWGGKDGYEAEARKLEKTRSRAGMPRVNDGALLFLQTMLAEMIPFGVPPSGGSGGGPAKAGTPTEGSRIAVIFNGSPLSNGRCGSGEREIRRWILENDWRGAEGDKPERPAFTIFPRYHQARLVRKVAEDVSARFTKEGNIGRKYLARRASDRPPRSPVRTSIPLPGSHPRASLRESLNHSASGMKPVLLATDLPIQGL